MTLPDVPLPPELAVDEPPLSDDDLAAYFDADEGSDPDLPLADAQSRSVEGWRIEADDQAEWALRKLSLAQEELRRLAEQAEDWEHRIRHWFVQAAGPHERTRRFMEERLEDYALRRREAGGSPTLQLPSGTIKTTEQKPKAEIEDEQAVADWIAGLMTDPDSWLWTAVEEAGFSSVSDVLKLTPKVYVGPLRKLVQLAEKPAGNRAHLRLRCGHTLSWDVMHPDDVPDLPDRGEFIICRSCPPDQEEPVESVDIEHLTRLVVVAPDGAEVPGASVKLGGIVPKVEAR